MSERQDIDWDAITSRVDGMDDAEAAALARALAGELRLITPVTADTKRALALLREAEEGDPTLIDRLEARRDEIEAEFFQLDAENDEEAPAVFQQARAMTALLRATKGVYSDAVYEAAQAVEEPGELLRALGLR